MPDDARTISDEATLRGIVGDPLPIVQNKEMPKLDKYCRQFIAMSPFLCLGTVGADGHVDMSPRGDPPGFVTVIDDNTIVLPERQGNQRVDSMMNLTGNPNVGLIFFLPGVEETLRIRGRATIVDDPGLLAPMSVNGKAPKLGLLVKIDTVFFQCAKALIRSKLWHPDTPIDRKDFPSFGQITRDQRRPESTVEEVEAVIQEGYRIRLY